jgi:hypothetical protein
MRKVLVLAALATLTGTAVSPAAHAACDAPLTPRMPDGAEASMQDMIAGQQAVQTFQVANMQYMQCLEKSFTAARAEARKSPDAATRAIAEAEYSRAVDAYNAAVSNEEEVAGNFNIELREYKAAQR